MVRVDDVEMTEGVASSTPHASRVPAPGATVPMEQWRDDVDRLLHLAQASPSSAKTGQRPPPGNAVVPYHQRQGGASASVRSPTVRGARTEDLRAELNRRRAGEDARVSIERAQERRLNI